MDSATTATVSPEAGSAKDISSEKPQDPTPQPQEPAQVPFFFSFRKLLCFKFPQIPAPSADPASPVASPSTTAASATSAKTSAAAQTAPAATAPASSEAAATQPAPRRVLHKVLIIALIYPSPSLFPFAFHFYIEYFSGDAVDRKGGLERSV
jgi:hypothetical protein